MLSSQQPVVLYTYLTFKKLLQTSVEYSLYKIHNDSKYLKAVQKESSIMHICANLDHCLHPSS